MLAHPASVGTITYRTAHSLGTPITHAFTARSRRSVLGLLEAAVHPSQNLRPSAFPLSVWRSPGQLGSIRVYNDTMNDDDHHHCLMKGCGKPTIWYIYILKTGGGALNYPPIWSDRPLRVAAWFGSLPHFLVYTNPRQAARDAQETPLRFPWQVTVNVSRILQSSYLGCTFVILGVESGPVLGNVRYLQLYQDVIIHACAPARPMGPKI